MAMKFLLIGVLFMTVLSACNNSNASKAISADVTSIHQDTVSSVGVAHELVCMVNDKFMAEKQILVTLNGSQYYGCCNNCKEKLEEDKKHRIAKDPYSKLIVDKSTAFITITGEDGTVSYFENADNYKKFYLSTK